MGAKNHGVVLPDANVDATLNALLAAGFGAAGQRCMALSTVVFVGNSKSWYHLLSFLHIQTAPNLCGTLHIFVFLLPLIFFSPLLSELHSLMCINRL